MSNTSIIAYVVLTIAIGYAFVYPSFGEVSTLLNQKQKNISTLEMVKSVENKKNELLAKFDGISSADKKNIDTVLPSSLDFVKLISDIDTVASKYGISIKTITSKEVSSTVGGSIENAAPSKPYQSSIIGFSFVASYDKFNAFLNELEKSLRILDIRTVKLETQENGTYTYSVEFETYWLP